jgi:hypothetical protein
MEITRTSGLFTGWPVQLASGFVSFSTHNFCCCLPIDPIAKHIQISVLMHTILENRPMAWKFGLEASPADLWQQLACFAASMHSAAADGFK